jgi:hypothetical protein
MGLQRCHCNSALSPSLGASLGFLIPTVLAPSFSNYHCTQPTPRSSARASRTTCQPPIQIKSHDLKFTEISFLSHNRREDVDWVNSASNKVRSFEEDYTLLLFNWFMRLTFCERLETRVDALTTSIENNELVLLRAFGLWRLR